MFCLGLFWVAGALVAPDGRCARVRVHDRSPARTHVLFPDGDKGSIKKPLITLKSLHNGSICYGLHGCRRQGIISWLEQETN